MRRYEVAKKIMESTRINENDQAYYLEMFITGKYTVEELKWIWE